jgi:hypothetical protein
MCARKALATLSCLVGLALGCCLLPLTARAQASRDCSLCVVASDCSGKRDACIGECRARLFTIDPKRAVCIDACNTQAAQCTRTADSSCRSQSRCP